MGVAREIGENLCGSAERLLGADDPVEATHGGQICGERGGIGQIGELAEKAEILCLKGRLQAFEKKSAQQPGKRLDGEKEVRAPLHREPSSDSPPPDATQWTWGWWVSAYPQVCRIARPPIFAPSLRGLAASVVMASTALLNRIA